MVDVLMGPLSGRENYPAVVGTALLGSVMLPIPIGPEYVAAELLPMPLWVAVTFDGVRIPVTYGLLSRIFSADGWFDSVVAAEAASGLLRLVSVFLVVPSLPLEVSVVPPGGVPVVAAMTVLLRFVVNAITRRRQIWFLCVYSRPPGMKFLT